MKFDLKKFIGDDQKIDNTKENEYYEDSTKEDVNGAKMILLEKKDKIVCSSCEYEK